MSETYRKRGNFRRVLIFVDGTLDEILTRENLDLTNKMYAEIRRIPLIDENRTRGIFNQRNFERQKFSPLRYGRLPPTWNFVQSILLFLLYMILWLYTGCAMGLKVPSMKPQHSVRRAPLVCTASEKADSPATEATTPVPPVRLVRFSQNHF